jgi:beta-barrel assembly-enhancing protease
VKRQNPSAKSGTFPAPGSVSVGTPSATMASLQVGKLTMQYPDNWKKYGKGNNATVAPDGGIVDSGKGQAELAYGLSASVARIAGQLPAGADPLQAATQKLIQSMQQENEGLSTMRESREVTLNGQRSLSTYLQNDSPVGGQETDWLITVMRPEGLVYFVSVAPQQEFSRFQSTFEAILNSVRFNN